MLASIDNRTVYCSAAIQASKQAGKQAGRWLAGGKASREAEGKAGRKAGRQAGGQECRQTDKQTDRGTARQMFKYTYRQTEIKTYGTDIHRHAQTNRKTDRQYKSTGLQEDKQTDVHIDKCSHIHTFSTKE
jgi:hypothetical protein